MIASASSDVIYNVMLDCMCLHILGTNTPRMCRQQLQDCTAQVQMMV